MGSIKKTLTVLSLLFLLWFSSLLHALDPGYAIDQYVLKKYDPSGKISGGTIYAMTQTPEGDFWLASNKGLFRFDGVYFWPMHPSLFTGIAEPPTDIYSTLYTDKHGVLWIGGNHLLANYSPRTGKFNTFYRSKSPKNHSVSCFAGDLRGNLWIGCHGGILKRYADNEFTVFQLPDSQRDQAGKVVSILENRDRELVAVTLGEGIFVFRSGNFTPVRNVPAGTRIKRALKSRDGDLWLGTSKGLVRVDRERIRVYSTDRGLSNENILDIVEDQRGILWIATFNGLNRLIKTPDNRIQIDNILQNHVVSCLFTGRENGLWVGTVETAFMRFQDPVFLDHPSGPNDPGKTIFSVFIDSNCDTWTGANQGKIFRLQNGKIVETLSLPYPVRDSILAIQEGHNRNMWFGTRKSGAFRLNRQNGRFSRFTSHNGLADDLIVSILRDSGDNLWFCTENGLTRHDHKSFSTLRGPGTLAGKVVTSAHEDTYKNIWVLTSQGISVLPNGNIRTGSIVRYDTGVTVTGMLEDRSPPAGHAPVYWFGTLGKGLMRLQDGKIRFFSTKDGLRSSFIYKIFRDDWEYIWMSGEGGVFKIFKNQLDRLVSGEIKRIHCTIYGKADGMISTSFHNAVSLHSALKAPGGELLFVTQKGITMVHPGKVKIDRTPPPVRIVDIFFRNFPSYNIHRNIDRDIVFYRRDHAGFLYTSPTFSAPRNVIFKYKLHPRDTDWNFSKPGDRHWVIYERLTPGPYTFHITACNRDGTWNETGASVSFTLKPCFSQTVYYKILLGLVFLIPAGAAVFLFIKYRKQLKTRSSRTNKSKYKNSNLAPQYIDQCITKLDFLMEIEKVYRDEHLSLQSLAEKISIHPHQLSRILNEKLHKNFPEYVNTYRIEEAKTRLSAPGQSGQKILSIAFEVGFNTKVAFNAAFKKHTHMTPSQYRDKIKEK